MAYKGNWPKARENKLKTLWKKSKHERSVFKELILTDEELKILGWGAVQEKCFRMELFGNAPLSKRFWFGRLDDNLRQEILEDLADNNVSLEEIILKIKERAKIQVSEIILRNLARGHTIRIKKANIAKKEEEQKPQAKDPVGKRIQELFEQGKLKELGVDGLRDAINKEFSGAKLESSQVENKLKEVILTPQVESQLEKILRANLDPEKNFAPYHPNIPVELINKWAREMTGISRVSSPATFVRGLNRITDSETLRKLGSGQFPETSFDKPFQIEVGKSNNWSLAVINGPNIGLKHPRIIKNNPVRRALADADRRRDAAVLIANVFDVNTKKAGGAPKVTRSLISGVNVNIEVLDPDYKARAKSILSGNEPDKLIYHTFTEVFKNLCAGWAKIVLGRDDKPEYRGKIYIIFGPNDEELIRAGAYGELRYLTIKRQHEIDVEISVIKHALKEAKKHGNVKEAQSLTEEFEAALKEKSRTTITGIADEFGEKFYNLVRLFVKKSLEEAIPNSQVIGQGTSFIKVGGELIRIQVHGDRKVTETLLAKAADKYGPDVLRGRYPDHVVVCHPYSPNYRMTCREVDADGQRGSAVLHVAPITVDGDYLKSVFSNITLGSVHPIGKLVFRNQFNPGILRLNCKNGIVSSDSISVKSLGSYKKYLGKEEAGKQSLVNYPECKFIWVMTITDMHFGSRAKEWFWNKAGNEFLGVQDAAIHMMRQAGLFKENKCPIHIVNSNDDPTQGNHYETHKQPDPHEIPYPLLEGYLRDKVKEASKTENKRLGILKDVQRFMLEQFLSRGLDWFQFQIFEVMVRHIYPNLDFYNSVLVRANQAGLIMKGISDYENRIFDHRNLGFINWGTGNHAAKTVDKALTEGFLYQLFLISHLKYWPEWKKLNGKGMFGPLSQMIKAPLHGNVFIGWGTVKAPGGYEWGLDFRDTPPKHTSWGDVLLGATSNDEQRGNYSRIFNGRKTLKTYGDKHFFGAVDTDYSFYHMCASATHTDTYGEHGFPPNNTGVSFIGLPVGGPESGPTLVRILTFDKIKKYFDEPSDFDWAGFLPNPA